MEENRSSFDKPGEKNENFDNQSSSAVPMFYGTVDK